MTLEERVQRLEDIEAIRYLQAKYQRCLDCRDFDGIGECFDIDVKTEYCNGYMVYEGRDDAVEFLCSCMLLTMPSYHLIHGGEIDIIDSTHAKAKWYLEDYLISTLTEWDEEGTAIYNNEYIKREDGKWYISRIGYTRCFEYRAQRTYDVSAVVNTNFLDAVRDADPSTLGKYGKLFQTEYLGKEIK